MRRNRRLVAAPSPTSPGSPCGARPSRRAPGSEWRCWRRPERVSIPISRRRRRRCAATRTFPPTPKRGNAIEAGVREVVRPLQGARQAGESERRCDESGARDLTSPPAPGRIRHLLALHGWGANALDLLGVAPYLAGGRFLVLCPQGAVEVPIGERCTATGGSRSAWARRRIRRPSSAGIDALVAFLDAAERRYPIARDKLALLGFSQGGVMAYALALARPNRFAALAALSTWMPPQLGGAVGAGLVGLSVLVQHGTRDDLIDGRARARIGRGAAQALRVASSIASTRWATRSARRACRTCRAFWSSARSLRS